MSLLNIVICLFTIINFWSNSILFFPSTVTKDSIGARLGCTFPALVNVRFTYLWQHISLFQVEKWSSDFLSVLESWTFFSSFARGISSVLGLLDNHDSSPGGQRRNMSWFYRSYLVELWVKAHKLFDPINAGWCTAIWSQAGVVVNRMGIFTVLLRVGPCRE